MSNNPSSTNEFIAAATSTIKEVVTTIHDRGNQYSDSWGKDATWLLTKAVVRKIANVELTDDQIVAIGLAVFVDQKYSRFTGGYKKDTAVDLIPYIAALTEKMKNVS